MLKYKSLIFILISFFFSFQASSQKISIKVFMDHKINKEDNDTIYYSTDRKLTWQDFQGAVPANTPWGAMTASGFSFNSSMNDDGDNIDITIGVFSFFIKHNSWKRPDIHSAYHLEHEQRHFDITQLGAEKLVSELGKTSLTGKNYKKILNSVFNKVYDENTALQQQYDLETKNGMDIVKQNEWNEKLEKQMEKVKTSVALKDKIDD